MVFNTVVQFFRGYEEVKYNTITEGIENTQHRGQEPVVFRAEVTGRTRDCLTRQVTEAVLIRRSQVTVLNSKSE